MHKGQTLDWLKLDNTGKIFPATSGKRNTSVFRFSCDLFEDVQPDKLQEALDITVKEFPHYLSVLRAGVFWHYLEVSNYKPVVHEESREMCSPLFNKYQFGLLFDVSYHKKRINLEVYHALADGTGAIYFLKNMMHHYLTLVHPELKNVEDLKPQYNAPLSSRIEDSFRKHYTKDIRKRSLKPHKAYKIKGEKTNPGTYVCIEGNMDCNQVKEMAKKHNASVTMLLAGLYVKAIHDGRDRAEYDKDIVVTVPVDLRNYFHSETARNFFGNIKVTYNVEKHGEGLDNMIAAMKQGFKEELDQEKLNRRLSRLMAFENNMVLKTVPLFIKTTALKIVRKVSEQEETTVISNVGKIEFPKELMQHIKLINAYACTSGMQMCVCTYGDYLATNFSSVFLETDVQRRFFKSLTDEGVKVLIRSNIHENER